MDLLRENRSVIWQTANIELANCQANMTKRLILEGVMDKISKLNHPVEWRVIGEYKDTIPGEIHKAVTDSRYSALSAFTYRTHHNHCERLRS